MVEIWFEPHATTLDNETKLASGWNDVDLSVTGLRQAQEMIERNRQRNLAAIFCSDLQRAVKTAVPSANELGIPIYVDARLRECDYGDMTGEPSKAVDAERAARIDKPFPNGQSYRQCLAASGELLDGISMKFDGQTILVIGHRTTQYALEVHAAGRTIEECTELPKDYWIGAYGSGMRYELA